jgi:hypothetical protein
VRTLILVMTNGPCPTSVNRVHFEEPEEFRLLPETCPVVVAYMPSIQEPTCARVVPVATLTGVFQPMCAPRSACGAPWHYLDPSASPKWSVVRAP